MEEKKEKKEQYYSALGGKDNQKQLTDWWSSLEKDRGGRAELKRCQTLLESAICRPTHTLRFRLPYWNRHPEIVACIAGILSAVRQDTGPNGYSFAEQLAKPREGSSKSPVSESRFHKLIKSRSWDDFYLHLRRNVQLVKGNVNICSLADGIIQWGEQHFSEEVKTGSDTLKFQWSHDYYRMFLKQKGNK